MAILSYLHKNPLIRWLMWKRYETILDLSQINKNMVAYEFGCGTGIFLPTLYKYSKKVYATDLYPHYAKKLASDFNLHIDFIQNIEDINEEIDLIIAADVIEHIEDFGIIIESWQKKLKNNGKLIISGPTENFLYKIGRFVAGFVKKGDYHVHNINEIRETIKSLNFELKSEKTLPFRVIPLFKILEFIKV